MSNVALEMTAFHQDQFVMFTLARIRRDVPEPARLLSAVARHQRLLRRRASVHRHPQDLLHGVRRLLLVTATHLIPRLSSAELLFFFLLSFSQYFGDVRKCKFTRRDDDDVICRRG